MSTTKNAYRESARHAIRLHGYREAQRLTLRWRDMSSPGTASFAFHNAVLKEINLAATVGPLAAVEAQS